MPDNALGEFYPDWLIKQADDLLGDFWTIKTIHAYCAPRMTFMGWVDRGPKWLKDNYTPDNG